MADTQYAPLGTVSVPADWTIPPSLEIILKTARATFNGASAAAAFRPAIEIISDSGHSVGLYMTDTDVAAGNSAEVSFYPFRSTQAASSQPVGVPDQEVIGNEFALIVTAGSAADFTLIQDSGSALLDFTHPTAPTIITTGVYAVTGYVTLSSTNSLTAAHDAVMVMDVGGTPLTCAASCVRGSTGGSRGMALSLVGKWTAPHSIHVTVHNWDTVSNQYACVFSVERLW